MQLPRCLSAFTTERPSNNALMELGTHMSNPAQLKSRAETEGSTNPVELTPRSAATEKVTSAIKLKDGRVLPFGGNDVPLLPPPGNFGGKDVPMPPPPGNVGAIKAPPGNFSVGQQPPPPQAPINHGEVQFPINHDKEEEEEEEVQSTRTAPGVNTWWTAEDIRKYLKSETPSAVVWKPWNAFIFDSITDFVSSLRAEASMPGAHFKRPEQRMTYDMVFAQAIRHLPPGYHVSIENGNPCPKELLLGSHDWDGQTAQYYHGATAHSLLRGIIRDGLKPTFGAGGETTARAWGQNTPMVYLSKLLECACFYPSHDATHAMNNYKEIMAGLGAERSSREMAHHLSGWCRGAFQ